MSKSKLWLRDEFRETERRSPLLPSSAKELIAAGMEVVVERSEKRIFPDHEYEAMGCQMAESGAWVDAPKGTTVLGLKELPETPAELKNSHIYFAHAYKQQAGWQKLLGRFVRGGGELLDLEYMVNAEGRRVVAFGYWAGYMGAALALMQWYDRVADRPSVLAEGLHSFENSVSLDEKIESLKIKGSRPKALVLGAHGRGGKGAVEILKRHGAIVTEWDREETANLDRKALLSHDILVNCAFVASKIPAFVRSDDIGAEGCKLKVITDVSCDPFSDFNPLPLYNAPTSWKEPFVTVARNGAELNLIAIDNLPSLLPREASMEFAGLLLPYLKTLDANPVWDATRSSYQHALKAIEKSNAA
ncbi:saccharopine dehydrogenase [Kordiimonas pumila]|uniref:Saccharopine dehydrogenase [NAD(+), L-lysine-forming] n=1 Tax=Kordiimonas pumila TaxID=2161677 RepID=A0ABV7DA99_9PROT|nr:saccharopine dehydrogenase [Kordiimonas pumila]